MGANLYWEPTKRKKHSLSSPAPSSFMRKLERAFGTSTPILTERQIPILQGMAAAEEDEMQRADFKALADALEQYEEIEVSAEY